MIVIFIQRINKGVFSYIILSKRNFWPSNIRNKKPYLLYFFYNY